MFELLNETLFEKHMAEYLAGSKMYNQRTPKDFNIQKLVDSDMLLQFLREQPIWQKLINQGFADEQDALNIVIETINTKINYNPQIEMFARFKMKSSFHKTKRII